MSENYITWNATNWLTVVLMVLGGFYVIGFASQMLKRQRGGISESAS